MIVTDKKGNKLLEIIPVDEENILNEYSPVTHALAVIKIGDKYLLGYNKYRKVWEIFGGCLENGETLRECIQRECKEEIGIDITSFKCIGLMKFYLVSDYFSNEDRIEYGALYSTQLPDEDMLTIMDTEEIGDISLYSKGDDIGEISIIDKKLLDYWQCRNKNKEWIDGFYENK